jgi:hypothetical protein
VAEVDDGVEQSTGGGQEHGVGESVSRGLDVARRHGGSIRQRVSWIADLGVAGSGTPERTRSGG